MKDLDLSVVPQSRQRKARTAFEARDVVAFLGTALAQLRYDLLIQNMAALRECGMYEAALLHGLIACALTGDAAAAREVEALLRRCPHERVLAAGDPLPGPGPFTIFQAAVDLRGLGICWTASLERAQQLGERLGPVKATMWCGKVDAAGVWAYVQEHFIVPPDAARGLTQYTGAGYSELRAKIRALITDGTLPSPPPLADRSVPAAMGPKPIKERAAPCSACGESQPETAYTYLDGRREVRLHERCLVLWQEEGARIH